MERNFNNQIRFLEKVKAKKNNQQACPCIQEVNVLQLKNLNMKITIRSFSHIQEHFFHYVNIRTFWMNLEMEKQIIGIPI